MNRIISLFLFIFVANCLTAQYNSPIKNKVTLGVQTTADGLIFRGVLGDTALITPLSDTSAYIILDTANHRFYNYNRATNVWSVAGGGTAVTSITGGTGLTGGTITTSGTLAADTSFLFTQSDTLALNLTSRFAAKQNTLTLTTTGTSGASTLTGATLNIPQYSGGGGIDSTTIKYVNTYGTQTVNGSKTFSTAPTFSTALLGGSGGTGITSFGAANRIPYAASTTALTTSGNLTYTTAGGLSQLGTGEQYFTVGSTNNVFSGINFKSNSGNNTIFHNGTGTGVFGIGGGGQGQGANKIAAFYGGISIGTNYMNTAVPLNSIIVEGKVGFGTITSPTDILHIGAISGNVLLIQSTGFAEYLTLQNTSGTGLGIKFTDTNASKFLYYKEGKLSFGSGGQVPSTFTSWGNLSVGAEDIAAPTNGLKVMGNTWLGYTSSQGSYNLQVKDSVYVGGNVSAAAYTTRSDFNLKDDIFDIKYGLNDILKLQPVEYTYKSNGSKQLGFIAQDIGTILPEVVSFEESMSVNYQAIIPILTKAIQEQQALIKALEQRIINLENK